MSALEADLKELKASLEDTKAECRRAEELLEVDRSAALGEDDEEEEDDDVMDEDEEEGGGRGRRKGKKEGSATMSVEDKERIAKAEGRIEDLQQEMRNIQTQIVENEAAIERAKRLNAIVSKHPPEVAKKVCELFPLPVYEPVLASCQDEVELTDIISYLYLIVKGSAAPRNDRATKLNSSKLKRLRGMDRDLYSRVCQQEKEVRIFSLLFTTPLPELAILIRTKLSGSQEAVDEMREGPPTPYDPVETVSAQFLNDKMSLPEDLLRYTRTLLAIELAAEPAVRGLIRTTFRESAVFCTKPTPKGAEIIGPFHELFGSHLLTDKPVRELLGRGRNRSLFVRLCKAKSDGLISIAFKVKVADSAGPSYLSTQESLDGPLFGTSSAKDLRTDSLAVAKYLIESSGLSGLYLPVLQAEEDTQPELRREWDGLRMSVLIDAVRKHLLPFLENELFRELLRDSREAVVAEMSTNFTKMLAVGPYRKPVVSASDVLMFTPRPASQVTVVSIMQSVEKDEALFMAFVDKDGVLRRHDMLPAGAWNQRREKLTQFFKLTCPDVIVVNSSGGQSSYSTYNMVKKYLVAEISNMLRREARERAERRRMNADYNRYQDEEEVLEFKPEVRLRIHRLTANLMI